MKTIIFSSMGIGSLLLLSAFIIQNNSWIAPDSASNQTNPVESNEKSLKLGKKIYGKMCWSCHGEEGKGDGPAGKSLNPKPANFTSNKIQQQKDGALYWKLTTGKGSMISYKNSLSNNQRWAVINYLRTLKK